MDVPADRPGGLPARVAGGVTLCRWWGLVPLLVAPLVPVIIFAPALAGHVLLAPDDASLYYLPVHELVAHAWHAGQLPAWNPFQLSGSPLLATQSGALYPLNLAFLVLPAVYANNVVVVVTLAIGAAGACLLARRLTGDEIAGAIGGIAFVSSGFAYGQIAHQPVLEGAMWLPWVLLAYDLLAERRSLPRFLFVSGTLALAALTGHTQMFFLILLVLAVYASATAGFAHEIKRERLKAFLLMILVLAGIEVLLPGSTLVLLVFMILFAGIAARGALSAAKQWLTQTDRRLPLWAWLVPAIALVSIGLAAVQLVPTAAILGQTVRSGAGIGRAISFSYSRSHAILWLFPYLFGNSYAISPFHALYKGNWNLTELAGYPGMAALVFATAGITRIRRDARALGLATAGLVAFLMSLGSTTGFGALAALLPIYSQFRAAGRYSVVVDLALAVFAAYGVAHMRASSAHGRRRAARYGTWTVGGLAVLGLIVPVLPGVRRFVVGGGPHLLAVGIPLAAASLAALSLFLFQRFGRAAVVICCVLVAADGALSFGAFFEWRHSPTPSAARSLYSSTDPPAWGRLTHTAGGVNRYLFLGRSTKAIVPYFPQVTDLEGVRSANGYDPLLSRRYAEMVGGMVDTGAVAHPGQFLTKRSWMLDILRVSTVLVPADEAPATRPRWFTASSRRGGLIRYEYRPRLPDSYLVGAARPVPSGTAVRDVRSAQFDPRAAAIIEGTCHACSALSRPGSAGRILDSNWSANSVALRIDATRRALLVVSQSWFPGWKATVDGHQAPVVRSNAVVLGVPVPPGHHDVLLTYEPPGFVAGAAISSATVTVFALAPILLYIRRRRRRPS